jgi:DNA-binding CsgD family transcriptional regulator
MFSNPTVKTVSEALLQLHRQGMRNDFPARLFACLKTAFSGDFFSYNECADNASERIELYPASAVNMDVLNGWIDQRREIRGVYVHGGPPSILHFCAPVPRRGPSLQDDLLVLLSQRHQLRVVIFDEQSPVNIVVSRSAQSFSGREYEMLETLRPHLVQSYKSSNERAFSLEAIGLAHVGLLVADRTGNILYATAEARKLIGKYFHQKSGLTLPDRVQSWLKEREKLDAVPALQELRIDFGRISLSVRLMSKTDVAQYRLLIRETVQTLDAPLLERLGLTRREAEVLFWASQGKSNSDIAIILASKVRTIAKHLERVFAKLMVENRTAAVRAALDWISSSGNFGGQSPDSIKRAAAQT